MAFLPPGFGEWRIIEQVRLPDTGHQTRLSAVALLPSDEGQPVLFSEDDSGRRSRWQDGEARVLSADAPWPSAEVRAADATVRFRFRSSEDGALVLDEDGVLSSVSGEESEPVIELGGYPLAAALTRDGSSIRLAVAVPGTIHDLRLSDGEDELQVAEHRSFEVGDHTLAIGISAEGVLRLDGEGRVWRWPEADAGDPDPAARAAERLGQRQLDHAVVATFDPEGHWVATGGDDGIVRVARVEGEEPLRLFGAPVLAVAPSPDGRWVAVGRGPSIKGPGSLELRDRFTGRALHRLHFEDWPPACLEVSADGSQVGVWNVYGQVRHHRIETASPGQLPSLGEARAGPPPAGPARCKEPDGRRFQIRLLKQVESDEVVIEDRRTGLFVPLDTTGPREGGWALVRHIPRRTLADHLLGRLALVGVDGDSALIIGRAQPRWPLPLLILAIIGAHALLVFVLRRRARSRLSDPRER